MGRSNGNNEDNKTEQELRDEAEKAVTEGKIDWNAEDED